MSEEQSGFKVTDRRLFNADGTPRDVEREESATRTPSTPCAGVGAAASSVSATKGDDTSSDQASKARQSATGAQPSTATDARQLEDEGFDDVGTEGGLPGADDPASFLNFLMSIASNAAAALGMMEHPVTGQRGVDLPLAKHWIDVLGMLQQKTQGNLAAQEQQIFEGLLSDLRLQYVSLTGTTVAVPPTHKRGFTGRDITGGK
jgi:Domain of unknown function (DUF1844)